MSKRGMFVCVLLAGMGLGAGWCWGQPATQPASPELGPVQTSEPGPAPGPAASEGGQDAATQPAPAPGPRRGADGGSMWWFYVILLGGFVLLYVWMGRSRRKQETKRKEMLSTLKKGDKIVTIGGIIGTVIETRPEEVTVKVDETNNVRMRFARWSIRGVGETARTEGLEDRK